MILQNCVPLNGILMRVTISDDEKDNDTKRLQELIEGDINTTIREPWERYQFDQAFQLFVWVIRLVTRIVDAMFQNRVPWALECSSYSCKCICTDQYKCSAVRYKIGTLYYMYTCSTLGKYESLSFVFCLFIFVTSSIRLLPCLRLHCQTASPSL